MKKDEPPSLVHARLHYSGGHAAGLYEQRRRHKRKWRVEDQCLQSLLHHIEGRLVLDVPVGTGRFLPLYATLGLQAVGVDVNQSMLQQASEKFPGADLRLGDASALGFFDGEFDIVVCVRLLHLITPDEMAVVMAELFRVARRCVIVSAYLAEHAYAKGRQQTHTTGALMACAPEPWELARAVPLLKKEGMGGYHMVQFVRL